jgi:hypothetical protein
MKLIAKSSFFRLSYLYLIVCFSLVFQFSVSAQDASAANQNVGTVGAGSGQTLKEDDPVQDVLTVIGLSGAGALLGLSTLSFVKIPRANLKNIVAGASLGLIAGVLVVLYNQSSKTHTDYNSQLALLRKQSFDMQSIKNEKSRMLRQKNREKFQERIYPSLVFSSNDSNLLSLGIIQNTVAISRSLSRYPRSQLSATFLEKVLQKRSRSIPIHATLMTF